MFNPGYYITAELKVKESANISKARQHLQELCEETLREPGCSIFTLHQCEKMRAASCCGNDLTVKMISNCTLSNLIPKSIWRMI